MLTDLMNGMNRMNQVECCLLNVYIVLQVRLWLQVTSSCIRCSEWKVFCQKITVFLLTTDNCQNGIFDPVRMYGLLWTEFSTVKRRYTSKLPFGTYKKYWYTIYVQPCSRFQEYCVPVQEYHTR